MKRSVPFLMLVVLLLAACATPSNNATSLLRKNRHPKGQPLKPAPLAA